MTLDDLKRLNSYWSRVPPLTVAVLAIAKSLGVELKPQEAKPKYMTPEEAKAFIRVTKGRIDGIGG